MKHFIAVLALSLVGSFAFANYDYQTTLASVGCQSPGGCYVQLPSNPYGCLSAIAYEPDTSTASQAMYATATAAFMNGRTVRINYTKNSSNIRTLVLLGSF